MTDFALRPLRKPEELRMAEELQRQAFGLRSEPPVPAALLRSLLDNGGLVLGAFHDIHLVGLTAAFVGWDGKELYYLSQLTAVLPEYRNHQVGYRLKLLQRDEVLKQGLHRIAWVFDPLQSRNAHLFLRRLGARADAYLPHYFGTLDSAADQGLATDRLRAEWTLDAPEVVARLEGRVPTPDEDLARVRASAQVLSTDLGDAGLRVPSEVVEPTDAARSLALEVPFDLEALREHQPTSLRGWRQATREAFRACFDLGWMVDDHAVVSMDHERRAYFLLARRPAPAPATTVGG